MNTFTTATEARKNLFKLLDKITSDPSYSSIINYHGKPTAVLINFGEWENLLETIEIASQPELVTNLKNYRQDISRGKVITYDEVFGHPQPGFNVADKSKIIYQVKKASKKTTRD